MDPEPDPLARKVARRLGRLAHLAMDDALDVADVTAGAPPPPPAARVRPARPADLEDLVALRPGTDAQEMADRLATTTGLLALEDGALVGCAWITTAHRPQEGDPPFLYEVTPPPGAAYVFDVWVRGDQRGRGHAGALLSAALAWAHAQGLRRVFLTRDRRGVAMGRATSRAGFRPAGVLRYRRWLGIARRDVAALRALERGDA